MKKFFLTLIPLYLFGIPIEKPENYPDDFLWGVGISEYQTSGAENCPDSDWAQWEKKINQPSGPACDFWNLYESDIKLMKEELGVTSFRFSLAWDRIEPKEGEFDKSAIDHYENIVDSCLKHGIKPMITFHHFVNPQWFNDIGGFEYESNCKYFVRFCKQVFERLSDKVELWITLNEPTIYMFQGYLRGVFPPGRHNPVLAMRVLKNLMVAHTETYKELKAMPNGDKAQIGIVHQYLKFFPYHRWNAIEYLPGIALNYLMNNFVLNFIKTGKFFIPGFYSYESDLEKVTDFIGLNYYSRVLVRMQLSLCEPAASSCYNDEIMTDMPYAMYPQGLYDAVADVSSCGVPIYVTENGIADKRDDRREKFIVDYGQSVLQAIKDGYDVHGYYFWSFMDNYEWDEGYTMKFGLYEIDFETQERTLREGARAYPEMIKSLA